MQEIITHNLEVRLWPAIIDPVCPFRGISKAHKQIVAWAKEQGLEKVCIAEDDFHLTGLGAWDYYLNNMPGDFDLYLSGIYYGFIENGVVKDFCALHLYTVHSRFYDTFLASNEMDNLDRQFCKKGKYVVCEPFAAIQHDGYSDHKRIYAKYGHLLNGRQLFAGGQVKRKYQLGVVLFG